MPTCFRQESSPDGRCCFGVWRSRPGRCEPAADRRIGTGTVDDYETHCPTGKPGIGSQTSMETSSAPRSEKLQGRSARWTTSLVLETWSERSKKDLPALFGTRCSNQQRWPRFGLHTVFLSVVKCARSQERPFTEDDEAAHEHITEHTRDLRERLLHEGDFSYEDITGQDEPPVDSPPAPEENTATEHQKPDGERHMDVDPEFRRRMRGKTD